MSTDETLNLKLPKAAKLEQIREVLQDDEDWRFGRPKIDGKKPRFELPAPTRDEPDNVELAKTFQAVVLVARKNFYQSDEDKENGVEPKEKRALYILRTGRYMPEVLYVSPTALRNWKYFVRDVVQQGHQYYEVLCEFSAELIKGKKYTWAKPKFAIARTLTEEESAHVEIMRELVLGRVTEYEDNAELDKFEEEALAVDKPKGSGTEEDVPKHKNAEVEDEDDPPAAPANKPKDKSKDKAPAPKEKTKSTPPPAEEEEEEPPKSQGRAGYPDLDADDDLSDVGGEEE